MDPQQGESEIAEWLARAQQNPAQAWREWSEGGVALLPLGSRFVASRLSEELVHAAAGRSEPQPVAACLEQLLDGPVIYDNRTMGGTYYPLMRCQSRTSWKYQHIAPLLAVGTYLGVPRLGRLRPPGTFWVVPPREVGDVCEPAAVGDLITLACTTVRDAER
ncbi:hypothetical protein [Streptomyces sp. NPDC051214]|uniref:hypothetical protein n=1 Tax=Streptomyces sp. NPDC051214 TaxID=3155282 RepID=UPI00342A91A1